MGRWQPYLYNAPQRESYMDMPSNFTTNFNPKAVTMASREPPSPRKKPEGPLVNMNQHPDSYLIIPYGNTNAKPMGSKVKVVVKAVRWVLLFFRVLTLLGAIGVLLCAIFIRGAADTEGYVMRIAPSVDLATTLYAIYHLIRAAKARPAASSASYHFFAFVTDAGFIPFYVFILLLSKRNSDMEAGISGRWRTFFPTDEETNKVLLTIWLTATTVAGLHCIALGLDLYLVIVFRKIARLPPDMNPLEDNLTSRRKTKHKHKSSSLSAITPLTADEKRFSGQSGTTTIVGSRNSQADPLMAGKDIPQPDERKMAFMHTRTNSGQVYSPHTPKSAHQSRQSVYAQSAAAQSRRDLNTRDDLHRRDDSDDGETLAQRKAFLAQKAIKRSSRPNSFVSSKQDYYTPPTTADNNDASGDLSLQTSLQSDNWFVHDEDRAGPPRDSRHRPKPSNGDYAPLPYPTEEYPAPKQSMFTPKKQAQGYNSLSMTEDVMSDDELEAPMVPQPLRMNPPTPPPTKSFRDLRNTPPPATLHRTLTTTSMSTTSTYSQSPTRTGTPKSRYYGDLKTATQGVKSGGFSPANSPSSSPTKKSFTPNHLPSATKQYTTNSPSPTKKLVGNSPFSLDKKSYTSVRRTGDAGYTPVKSQSPRVVSRTGIDYMDTSTYDYDDVSDLGSGRRDVSGKIAEEGRGGVANLAGRWGGMKGQGLTYRKVSGVS